MSKMKKKTVATITGHASKTNIEVSKSAGKSKDELQASYDIRQVQFKTIFDESPLGNKIINEELKILKVNRKLQEILGYSEGELLGRQIAEFTADDFLSEWQKLREELWLASDPRTSFSIEACLIRKDGSLVSCQITSILFKDDGKRLGYTIVEDITARLEAQRIKDNLAEKEHLLKLKHQEQEKQKELFAIIIQTQEEERERIAEQLHNSLGQMLYAVKINLNLVKLESEDRAKNEKALAEATKLLSESIIECRRTSHYLLPKILKDFGLKEAIEDLCTQFRPTIQMKLSFKSLAPIKDEYAEIVIFRTVQELLLNVVKHAEASTASCGIHVGKKDISIRVEDNGKGFDPNALREHGIGLSAMKNRIEQMKGNFNVSSSLGQGTCVNITLPRRKF
jgi:PAS domain S-box-containing protein